MVASRWWVRGREGPELSPESMCLGLRLEREAPWPGAGCTDGKEGENLDRGGMGGAHGEGLSGREESCLGGGAD